MNGVWCQLQHCDFGSESMTPIEIAGFLCKHWTSAKLIGLIQLTLYTLSGKKHGWYFLIISSLSLIVGNVSCTHTVPANAKLAIAGHSPA